MRVKVDVIYSEPYTRLAGTIALAAPNIVAEALFVAGLTPGQGQVQAADVGVERRPFSEISGSVPHILVAVSAPYVDARIRDQDLRCSRIQNAIIALAKAEIRRPPREVRIDVRLVLEQLAYTREALVPAET